MTIREDHPIQWIENQDCSWRNYGEMTLEKCFELFGIDYSDEIEETEFGVVIGLTLFTDNFKNAKIEMGDALNDVEDILPLKDLEKVNFQLLKEFKRDLNDHYSRENSGDWSNIPVWKETVFSVF